MNSRNTITKSFYNNLPTENLTIGLALIYLIKEVLWDNSEEFFEVFFSSLAILINHIQFEVYLLKYEVNRLQFIKISTRF